MQKISINVQESYYSFIFNSQKGEDGVEVRVEDENVWLTQKLIAKLFEYDFDLEIKKFFKK